MKMSRRNSGKSGKKKEIVTVRDNDSESESEYVQSASGPKNKGVIQDAKYRKGATTSEGSASDSSDADSAFSGTTRMNKQYRAGISQTTETEGIDGSDVEIAGKGGSSQKLKHTEKATVNTSFFMEEDEESSSENDDQMMERVEAKIEEKKSKVNILQNVTLIKHSPEEELAAMYPGLVPLKPKLDIDLSNADLYMLMVPTNIDANILLGQESIHQKCKFKMGKKFVLRPTNKLPDPCLVIANGKSILQFKDHIIMSQYMKENKLPELEVEQQAHIGLPDNLKSRHPLFGASFDSCLQLGKEVQHRLKSAIITTKKTKKRKEKIPEVQEPENKEIIYGLLKFRQPLSNSNKKSKSNKVSDDSAFSSCSSSGIMDCVPTNKVLNDVSPDKQRKTSNADSTKQKKKVANGIATSINEILIGRDRTEIEENHATNNSQSHVTKRKRNSNTSEAEDSQLRKKAKNSTDQFITIKKDLFPKNEANTKPSIANKNQQNQSKNNYPDLVKIKKELYTEYETEAETCPPRKKKKQRRSFTSVMDRSQEKSEYDTDTDRTVQKKKMRKNNLVRSEESISQSEYETEYEVTKSPNEKVLQQKNVRSPTISKKKKVKSPRMALKQEHLTEYETDFEIPDKPKEKVRTAKQHATDIVKGNKHQSDSESEFKSLEIRPKRKKIPLKTEPQTEYETDVDVYTSRENKSNILFKERKKKKNKSLKVQDLETEYETDFDKTKEKAPKTVSLNSRNLKREPVTEYETDFETTEQNKKKKRKLKMNNVETAVDKFQEIVKIKKEILTEYETDADIPREKNKKRQKLGGERLSFANSTLMVGKSRRPSFNPDISGFREEALTWPNQDDNVINSDVPNVNSDFKDPKKIKKMQK